MKLNLACGDTFVTGNGWVNLDFYPLAPSVMQADLLAPLPFASGSVDVVYSSHFLEHVPRSRVPSFLAECLRVLRSHGRLRLVLPDLENICRAYISERDAARHERADFLVLELIDQCVRQDSGGELGRFYDHLGMSLPYGSDLADFVQERTGHRIVQHAGAEAAVAPARVSFVQRTGRRLRAMRLRVALALLPRAFRAQNVSLAEIGERHQWMWDFHMLSNLLCEVGFEQVERFDCVTSGIPSFPWSELDASAGLPRKGTASMFLEAVKPTA